MNHLAFRKLIVMGVSGCGKSTLSQAIAHKLGWTMIEGDDYHPPSDIEKMRAGVPLSEKDRTAWLKKLNIALRDAPPDTVLACSALKRSHREILRENVDQLGIVFMTLTLEQSHQRVANRQGHFFPSSLVADQFSTLEPPTDEVGVLTVDGMAGTDRQFADVCAWLGATT